jgi:hypothetical protein
MYDFKVGDEVKRNPAYYIENDEYDKYDFEHIFIVREIEDDIIHFGDGGFLPKERLMLVSSETKKKTLKEKIFRRKYMNKNIIELFPKTKDAVLVEKYFKAQFENPLSVINYKGKQAENRVNNLIVFITSMALFRGSL